MHLRQPHHLQDLLSHGILPQVLEGWEDLVLDNPIGQEGECTPENFVFLCIHLFEDPTVKARKYSFREPDGSEVWRGDLLCENCMEKDVTGLAKDGTLVMMTYGELLDAVMGAKET